MGVQSMESLRTDGTIKVYTADVAPLNDEARFRRVYEHVSAQRREKVDQMRLGQDKRLSLGAGALLESALEAEGVRDLAMTGEDGDKPRLAHVSGVSFNLSHAGTKVMCAVSDSDIGCDVEQVRDIGMKIARRFFCAEEYAALLRCESAESRNDLFFRYWTLKESFMKATGRGFQLPLDSFCMILEDGGVSVRQSLDGRAYFFREFDRRDGYKYAVCSVDKPIRAISFREMVF